MRLGHGELNRGEEGREGREGAKEGQGGIGVQQGPLSARV